MHQVVGVGGTASSTVTCSKRNFVMRSSVRPSFGYWWAAGVFWVDAVIRSHRIRGGTRLHHEACQTRTLDEIVSALI